MIGYIYICRREHSITGLLKIGHTDNLERRMSDFDRETGADSRMKIEFAFGCPIEVREQVERRAHLLARDHRRRGEWFELDLPEAIKLVHLAGVGLGVTLSVAHDAAEARAEAHRREVIRLEAAITELRNAPLQIDTRAVEEKRRSARWMHRDSVVKARAKEIASGMMGYWLAPTGGVAMLMLNGFSLHDRNAFGAFFGIIIVTAIVGFVAKALVDGKAEERARAEASEDLTTPAIEAGYASALASLTQAAQLVRNGAIRTQKAELDKVNASFAEAERNTNYPLVDEPVPVEDEPVIASSMYAELQAAFVALEKSAKKLEAALRNGQLTDHKKAYAKLGSIEAKFQKAVHALAYPDLAKDTCVKAYDIVDAVEDDITNATGVVRSCRGTGRWGYSV